MSSVNQCEGLWRRIKQNHVRVKGENSPVLFSAATLTVWSSGNLAGMRGQDKTADDVSVHNSKESSTSNPTGWVKGQRAAAPQAAGWRTNGEHREDQPAS